MLHLGHYVHYHPSDFPNGLYGRRGLSVSLIAHMVELEGLIGPRGSGLRGKIAFAVVAPSTVAALLEPLRSRGPGERSVHKGAVWTLDDKPGTRDTSPGTIPVDVAESVPL